MESWDIDEVRLRFAYDEIDPPFNPWLACFKTIQYMVKLHAGKDITRDAVFPHLDVSPVVVDPHKQYVRDKARVIMLNHLQQTREDSRKRTERIHKEAFEKMTKDRA